MTGEELPQKADVPQKRVEIITSDQVGKLEKVLGFQNHPPPDPNVKTPFLEFWIEGKSIGKIFCNKDGKVDFSGDLTESAQKFFEFIKANLPAYLKIAGKEL